MCGCSERNNNQCHHVCASVLLICALCVCLFWHLCMCVCVMAVCIYPQALTELEDATTDEGWDLLFLTRKLIKGFWQKDTNISKHIVIPEFTNWSAGYALSLVWCLCVLSFECS